MATSSSVVKEIKIIVDGGQATASIDGVTVSTKKLNSELVKLSQNAGKGKGASGATGGATATVLELGRTISDSNYGIRGMANNLSQLASNFVFTTKAAGGLSSGLKSIWAAMMGPLGLVLAFQGTIALLERWSMGSKKVDTELDIMGNSVTDTSSKLRILNEVLTDENATFDEQKRVLESAREELEDYGIEVDTSQEGIHKMAFALSNLQVELERTAIAQGYANVLQEQYNDIAELTTGGIEEQIDWYDTLIAAVKNIDKMGAPGDFSWALGIASGTVKEGEADLEKEITRRRKKINSIMEILRKDLGDDEPKSLMDYLLGKTDEKKDKETTTRVIKDFKSKYLDLSKEISKFQKDEELSTEENEFKKLEIKQKYERIDLENKKNSFIEKEELRLENFLKTTEDEAKIAEAKATFNKMELQAEKEHQDALTELTITQASKRFNFALEIARESTRKYQEAVDAGEIQALTFGMTQDAGVDALNAEAVLLKAQYDQKVYWLDEEIKERKRDGDSYMDLIKQKLNAEKQFNNDKLVLTEKTEEAKLDIVQYGFEVIASIAEKGSAIGKAAAVAATLMSTRKAAVAALGAEPYGPWNIAQAALVTAMGLSNVNKILNTPTPTRNGGTTTSAGASGGGRTFDFNLVGSTGTNQLA